MTTTSAPVKSSPSDRYFRLLCCTLSLWLLILYLAIVLPLDGLVPSINRWQVAGSLSVLSFFGTCAGVARLDKYERSLLMNLTLLGITLVIGFLAIDVGTTAHFNLASYRNPDTEAGRDLDERAWDGELLPNLYYPSEANFKVYKPLERKGGYSYGEQYYPGLLQHPVIKDSVLRLRKIEFSIDQYGLRNTDPPQQSRIFALGDSFCFGYHTTQEETFEELLKRRLGQPVYNMGVSGTSPLQQLLLLKHFLDKYPNSFVPSRLLWLIFEGNDLEDSYAPKRFQAGKSGWLSSGFKETIVETITDLPARLRRESVLRRLTEGRLSLNVSGANKAQSNHYMLEGDRLAYPLYHSSRFGYRLFRPEYLERATKPRSYVLDHPNRPRLDDTFRQMRDLSQQRKFIVTVVIVPSAVRLYKDAFEDFPPVSKEPHFINYVKRLSEDMGFRRVDLNELMAPYSTHELLYQRDDTHWNERGHELVADLLARYAFPAL
jgi:hypothetical protein